MHLSHDCSCSLIQGDALTTTTNSTSLPSMVPSADLPSTTPSRAPHLPSQLFDANASNRMPIFQCLYRTFSRFFTLAMRSGFYWLSARRQIILLGHLSWHFSLFWRCSGRHRTQGGKREGGLLDWDGWCLKFGDTDLCQGSIDTFMPDSGGAPDAQGSRTGGCAQYGGSRT